MFCLIIEKRLREILRRLKVSGSIKFYLVDPEINIDNA